MERYENGWHSEDYGCCCRAVSIEKSCVTYRKRGVLNVCKRVTIIVPYYNCRDYVTAFLESVLHQLYCNLELIMVDDGSTDGTYNVVCDYQKTLNQREIEFIHIQQSHKGQAAAINEGLKYFCGEYLMWADADDILLPDNVKAKVEFLENHPECDFVLTQGVKVNAYEPDKELSILKRVPPSGEDTLFDDYIHDRNGVYGPGVVLVRREAFFKVNPRQNIYEGTEGQNIQLMLPLAYSCKCGYIERPLFKYVIHSDSHSNRTRSYEENIMRCDGFEQTYRETILQIPQMNERERCHWIKVTRIKCYRMKLTHALTAGKHKDAGIYRRELRKMGCFPKMSDYSLMWRKVMRKLRNFVLQACSLRILT